jgi:hypothetical protein
MAASCATVYVATRRPESCVIILMRCCGGVAPIAEIIDESKAGDESLPLRPVLGGSEQNEEMSPPRSGHHKHSERLSYEVY